MDRGVVDTATLLARANQAFATSREHHLASRLAIKRAGRAEATNAMRRQRVLLSVTSREVAVLQTIAVLRTIVKAEGAAIAVAGPRHVEAAKV